MKKSFYSFLCFVFLLIIFSNEKLLAQEVFSQDPGEIFSTPKPLKVREKWPNTVKQTKNEINRQGLTLNGLGGLVYTETTEKFEPHRMVFSGYYSLTPWVARYGKAFSERESKFIIFFLKCIPISHETRSKHFITKSTIVHTIESCGKFKKSTCAPSINNIILLVQVITLHKLSIINYQLIK